MVKSQLSAQIGTGICSILEILACCRWHAFCFCSPHAQPVNAFLRLCLASLGYRLVCDSRRLLRFE